MLSYKKSTLNLIKSSDSHLELVSSKYCSLEKWRNYFLKIFFLFIIGIALLYSSTASYFSSNTKMYAYLNGGDQLLIPVSTYFSKEVHFDTVDSNLSRNILLRVLPNVPNISSNLSHSVFGSSFQMASWTYEFWGLRLLKGTSVKISVCADLYLQFYLLFGERKMTLWKQVVLFSDYDYHANIRPCQHCNKKNNYNSVTLKVNRSDTYYLLFSSTVGWRFFTKVSVILEFNRTYYDVANVKYSCLISDKNCFAKLNYGSSDISLLEAIPSAKNNSLVDTFQKYTVVYTPSGRVTFYLKLYSSIYLIILVLTLFYVVWRYCTDSSGKYKYPPLLETNKKYSFLSQVNRSREQKGSNRGSIMLDATDHTLSDLTESMQSFKEPNNDFFNNKPQYGGEQRLMDSCLTSAGVSAI